MTLSDRNKLIKGALIFLLAFSVFIFVIGVFLLTKKSSDLNLFDESPTSIQEVLNASSGFGLLKENKNLFVVQNMLYPIYALVIMWTIYFLFEKTYVIEISFFIFAVILCSLESLKLLIPFFNLWIYAPGLVVFISKFVYFFRTMELLLLLFASIFIVAPFTRRMLPMLFALSFLSFALTSLTPFNTTSIMSNFLIDNGFSRLGIFSFCFFCFAVTATYLIAGKTLNAKEYTSAGWGLLVLLIGFFFSVTTANILFFILSNVLFIIGICFYLRGIHSYNLWQ